MKNLTLITSFFFLFLFQINAQDRPDLAIDNIPANLLEGVNAVIRHESGLFIVDENGSAVESRKMEITRLNKQAQHKKFYVGYDMHSKIGKIRIELYDAQGNLIRKLKKDEINDFAAYDGVSIYSDNRMKRASLTHSSYPYTIVYEYDIQHKGLLTYPSERIPFFEKTSTEQWDFTIKVPTSMPFKYRVFNSPITPEEKITDNIQSLTFATKNIQPVKKEPLIPTDTRVSPMVAFLPEKFSMDGYSGGMSDWNAFGKFMFDLNKSHNNLSEEMIAEVKKMTAEATTNAEKIDILYKYVQENMRYVSIQLGIGGWQSFDAAYVEKNKYGDCKALTWFTKSMLESIGIESYPALVLAGKEHTMMSHPEDFSYPQFNHVILTIPSEEIWMECTSTISPTNYLGSFTDNRSVLLITEEGGKLTRTPMIPVEKNAATRKVDIQLSENGEATVINSTLLTGPQQENIRYFEKNYSKEELEKWFLYTTSLPSCEIKKLEIQADRDHPKALLNYEVSVRKYGSKGGKRMFVPANCINPFDDVPDALENRQHPVVVKRGYVESDEITLHLPEGYEVESIPKSAIELTSEFGDYTIDIENNKETGQLVYKRKLKILPVDLPAERYDALREFYLQIAKMDKMKVVLVEERT